MSIPGSGSPLLLATTAAAAADAYVIPKSLRFNDADGAYLSSTISGNITTFTYSFWVKRCVSGNRDEILDTPSSTGFYLYFDNDGYIKINDNTQNIFTSNGQYRDPSAWMQVVVNNNGSTFNLYVNGALDKTASITTKLYSGAIEIGSDHSTDAPDYYLADVQLVDGQALAPTDFGETRSSDGVWVAKEYSGTYGTNGFHLNFSDSSTNEALGFDSAPTIGDTDPKKGFDVITYTGTGAIQNIGGLNFEPDFVWIKNRTDSSAAEHRLIDTVRGATNVLYSNLTNGESTEGASLTTFNPDGFTVGSGNYVNGSSDDMVAWCWRAGGPAVANTNGSINSQVSANNDYGFSIVSYSGTGSNATVGHGLSSAPKWILVKDRSQSTGFAVYHDAIGTSTNNYIELHSTGAAGQDDTAFQDTAPTSSVFSIGTKAAVNESGDDFIAYCWSEVSGFSKFSSFTGSGTTAKTITTGFKPAFVILRSANQTANWVVLDRERGSSWLEADGDAAENSNSNQQITFENDGFTVSGGKFNADGQTMIYMAFADRPGNHFDVNNIVTNEGLTTSKSQFDIVTYTGTGSSQSLSLSFQPDLIWCKTRSNAVDHKLVDSVRGLTKVQEPNNARVDSTDSNGITATSATGFTVGSSSDFNTSGRTYAAWCWKAGGTAVSNTDGSIASSVSANAQYGFSIVSYTGTGSAATIGHGLSSTPKMILVKPTSASGSWQTFHVGIGNTGSTHLNSVAGVDTASSYWNNTDPTSSVFTVGSSNTVNQSGTTFIAYCFANVPGYQRIGSVETGSNPVVITGFKPRFLLTKKIQGSEHWFMHDSQRDTNDDDNRTTFEANNSNAEETGGSARKVVFLNDGFQLVGGDVDVSGGTTIYWAIGDDEIGSDEDCVVDVPNAVTADADATDTTGGYQRGNYCTWNGAALVSNGSSNSTFTNGNLQGTTSNSNVSGALGTIGVSSGKWYYEITCGAFTGGTGLEIGASQEDLQSTISTSEGAGDCPNGYFYINDGRKVNNSSASSYGASYTDGDVIGVALDLDNSTIEFFKNGVSQGDAYTSMNDGTYFPAVGDYNNSGTASFTANFGQMRFKYSIPTGYSTLNTTALPAATIADGSTAFGVLTYSGNGNARTLTGLNMNPDFIWIKSRSSAQKHVLVDSVRTTSTGEYLASDSTQAEGTGVHISGTENGITIADPNASTIWYNDSSHTYVAWAWDAGSSTVSNTDGSISANVRANQSAGFSIIKATISGSGTIGHGLNAKPHMVFRKRIDSTSDWYVAVDTGSVEGYLLLNSTATINTESQGLTSSVFTAAWLGNSGEEWINYAFAPVAGYSAIGTYQGNGSSDGPMVYTGFRPKWILMKNATTGSTDWRIYDTERSTDNPMGDAISANTTAAEISTSNLIDGLSNGFKCRGTGSFLNTSGDTFVYLALAENPLQANGGLAR